MATPSFEESRYFNTSHQYKGSVIISWLSGYSKRKELVLTGGASGAQTDFQLELAVPYAAAMQGDFDDLRFTQANGTTLIDAWLESKVDDTSAVVFAEFPTTPANTVEQDYYMYYGNVGAANYWNARNTFLFGNDFEDGGVTDWTDESGSTITAVGTPVKYGSYAGHHSSTTAWAESYVSYTSTNADRIVDVWLRKGETNLRSDFMIEKVGGDYNNSIELSFGADSNIHYYDPTDHNLGSYSANTWYHFVFTLYSGADYTFDLDIDDVSKVTGGGTRGTVNAIAGIGIMSDGNSAADLYIDNLLMMKYAANPPTYAFGSEESVPGNPYWYYNMLRRRN